MSGEKGELFQHDSVFFDPLSFFSHRSGGQQGIDSAPPPFTGFADFGSLLTKSFNSTSSIFQEAFGSDEPTASAQAISFASGDGGRMPVTANSSVSSLSTEVAGEEDCYKNEKNEEMELQQQQEEEENKEGKKDEDVDDGDDDDKAKKGVKARKKGEKRQRDQPRFAFMTRSQVDHLEDGYRWRKYGQKAVKNSPFPRSYYRCTTQKCAVKKRVERSYQDPSVVITTYEGQHTHYYPANARGSSHMLASPPASAPSLHHHDLLLQTLTQPLQQQLHLPADYDLLLLQDIYTSIINSNQA